MEERRRPRTHRRRLPHCRGPRLGAGRRAASAGRRVRRRAASRRADSRGSRPFAISQEARREVRRGARRSSGGEGADRGRRAGRRRRRVENGKRARLGASGAAPENVFHSGAPRVSHGAKLRGGRRRPHIWRDTGRMCACARKGRCKGGLRRRPRSGGRPEKSKGKCDLNLARRPAVDYNECIDANAPTGRPSPEKGVIFSEIA